jgi:hypothetical protein
MEALEQCRTEALGGPVYPGLEGGALASSAQAGTNRHGPTGHQAEARPGLEPPRELRLPGPSFLLTVTRPEARRPGARSQQPLIDHLRVQTAAATLKARAPHSLGGQSGRGGVLPPWTRELAAQPPLPSLVPGGALSPDGSTGLSPPL